LAGLVFEQFTINMLNLMRSILRCEAYTPAKTLEGLSMSYLLQPLLKLTLIYFIVLLLCFYCLLLFDNYKVNMELGECSI